MGDKKTSGKATAIVQARDGRDGYQRVVTAREKSGRVWNVYQR